MEKYVCKECGKDAFLKDGQIVRSCEHNTTVTLQLEVVVTGDGGCDA